MHGIRIKSNNANIEQVTTFKFRGKYNLHYIPVDKFAIKEKCSFAVYNVDGIIFKK